MSANQNKWMIKDGVGRVRGPYSTHEILQQISRGVIEEEESVAIYPNGDWQKISTNPEFYDHLLGALEKEAMVETVDESISSSSLEEDQSASDEDIDQNVDQNFNQTSEEKIDSSFADGLELGSDPEAVGSGNKSRVFKEDISKDEFIMGKGPSPLPNAAGPNVESAESIGGVDPDVIDLGNKKDIIKEGAKKKSKMPLLFTFLFLIVATGFYLSISVEKKKIHLKAPGREITPLAKAEVDKLFKKALFYFYKDDFASYWKSQSTLIPALEGAAKDLRLRSLLCLVHRELWEYSYKDDQDLKVFTKVAGKTSALDPGGKAGRICDISLSLIKSQFIQAEKLIEASLPENVRDAVFYELRADLWMGSKKSLAALDYLETSIRLNPRWIKPRRLRAKVFKNLGKIPEAFQAYTNILKMNTKHSIAKINLGEINHIYYSKNDKALAYFSEVIKLGDRLLPSSRFLMSKSMGEIFYKRNEKNKSLKSFKEALSINSRDIQVRERIKELGGKEILEGKQQGEGEESLALGEQYERQGDCFAAQAEFRAVFKNNPKNAVAAFKAAGCLWKLSQAEEALDWLTKAIKADPKYIDAYVKKAEYFTERYDFRSASQLLKRAQKLAPRNHLVYQGMARFSLKKNDFKSTLTYTQKALRLYKNDTTSLVLLIKAHLGMGKLENYQKAFERASQLKVLAEGDPESESIYIKTLALVQNIDLGLAKAREMIESYPYEIKYRILFGELLKKDERYDDAEAAFKQIVQIDGKNKEGLLKLGSVLELQGKYNDARDAFLRAAALDPSDAQPLFDLGKLYLAANKPKLALVQFERVLRSNRLFPNGHYFSGQAAKKIGDLERALEEARKEARINPNRAEAYLLMGEIYLRQRDYGKCVTSYQKAISLRVGTSFVYINIARCYRQLGSLDTALQLLKRAEAIESGNPQVWKEMGAICEKKNDTACAIEAYRRYFTLAPNALDRKIIENRILQLEGR